MRDSIVVQAERIARGFLHEQVIESYPIIGKGIVNQVCAVETEHRKVVVRMNDIHSLPSYMKEKWCIEQAAAAGIPSPKVLSVGVTDETAYMIQTFADGCNGLDSTIPKSSIWRQLGEYAKRIHSIQAKGYGENLIDPDRGEFQSPPHSGSDGSWLGYVQYNMNSLTDDDRLIELGVITTAESQGVRKLFEQVKKRAFRFGVTHGDLSLKNTIVSPAGEIVLLDWGSAEVTVVPHGDIITVMQSQIQGGGPSMEEFEAFLDGYGISEQDLADTRHLLLLRAFDKLRWAMDRSPDLIESYAAYAKQVFDLTGDVQ